MLLSLARAWIRLKKLVRCHLGPPTLDPFNWTHHTTAVARLSWRTWSLEAVGKSDEVKTKGGVSLALTTLIGFCVPGCASEPCVDDGFFQSSNEDCSKLLRSSCSDKLRNGNESDVDCGGSCQGCPDGKRCDEDSDCVSGACVNEICVEAQGSAPVSCVDGVKNGDESGIDCGQACPAACENGQGCNSDADCESGRCDPDTNTCVAISCVDENKNNRETDVDCGGRTCPGCHTGRDCIVHFDCISLSCSAQKCDDASCTDGLPNGKETDVDCGGGECNGCPNRASCELDRDCLSQHCVQERCVGDGCLDKSKSQSETDVDCGGPECSPCADTKACKEDRDCASKQCSNEICVAATCSDQTKNGAESDIDCGRSCPQQCELGKDCLTNTDCKSDACVLGHCAETSCTDGSKSGTETDVDCGGSCGATCEVGESCSQDSDCRSLECQVNGTCAASKCDDKKKNGFETGVDCGGLYCPGCPDGDACIAHRDCLSNLCLDETCVRPPGCDNKLKDGDETDVDCGGICGATCEIGESCKGNQDCASGTCKAGLCEGTIYQDQDKDGFGDPSTGKTSSSVPAGWVVVAADCDDQDKNTYPGAAKLDSPTDCTKDSDKDGRGDVDAKEGVTKGSDCYDQDPKIWACLEATVPGACREASANDSDALSVTASLGTGNYTYQWSPDQFLTGADTATPVVNGLDRPMEYTVTVQDGVRSVERVILALPQSLLKFNAGDCQIHTKLLKNGDDNPELEYRGDGIKVCEKRNGELALHMCGIAKYENVKLKGELLVETPSALDDDHFGFVWGVQDASNFYVIAWKKVAQTIGGLECDGVSSQVPRGLIVKKIHDSTKAGDPKGFAHITGKDLFCEHDTDRSKLLLGPSDTMNQSLDVGWERDRVYTVSVNYTKTGSKIEVTQAGANPGDAAIEISSFEVVDSDSPWSKGGYGSLSFSQPGACAQNFKASCLP